MKNNQTMKVQDAIKTIENLGYKLIKRQRYWNGDTNRHETQYKFKTVEGARHDWAHEVDFSCLRELRIRAKQFSS